MSKESRLFTVESMWSYSPLSLSNKPKEARAYLLNLYRYDGIYKYACQICHEASSNIEIGQLFKKTETELDPMNLCLCPNCHAEYAKLRNGIESFDEKIKDKIFSLPNRTVVFPGHGSPSTIESEKQFNIDLI